eukprot:6412823-Pyramimonas_sp.AAC.1
MRRSLTLRAHKCFSDEYLAAQLQQDPQNEGSIANGSQATSRTPCRPLVWSGFPGVVRVPWCGTRTLSVGPLLSK